MRTPSGIRRALSVALGLACLVCASGCEDNPASSGFVVDIRLARPLTLDWAGKSAGSPFVSHGTFRAQASHRVEWRLEITAVPANPNDGRFNYRDSKEEPRLTVKIGFQKDLAFGWDVTRTVDTHWHFAAGDTCTAKVTTSPPLSGSEAHNAVFRFVVGGGELPDN